MEIENLLRYAEILKQFYGQTFVFTDSSFENQQFGSEHASYDPDLYNLNGSMNHIMNFSPFPPREFTLPILIIHNFILEEENSF